jgi:hypothetical protein
LARLFKRINRFGETALAFIGCGGRINRKKVAKMNKKIKYGSTQETIFYDAREQRSSSSRSSENTTIQRNGFREWLVQQMEERDPGGKKAHQLAAKYRA